MGWGSANSMRSLKGGHKQKRSENQQRCVEVRAIYVEIGYKPGLRSWKYEPDDPDAKHP